VGGLGAILVGQNIKPPPDSDELIGLERAIHQAIPSRSSSPSDPLKLTLREHLILKSLFNKAFSERLHIGTIPDTSDLCKLLE
jgi:hypothetical protein